MTVEYDSSADRWYVVNQASRRRRRICGACREDLVDGACPQRCKPAERPVVAR